MTEFSNKISTNISLPSKPAMVVDVPEVKNFKGSFSYNFFVSDEGTNDEGTVLKDILKKSSESIDSSFIDSLESQKYIPRFVRFTFKPISNTGHTKNEFISATDAVAPSIKDNLDKIISEEDFSDNNFFGVEFQDSTLDGKLFFFVSGSLSTRINSPKFDGKISEEKTTIDPSDLTLLDSALLLNDITPDKIEGGIGMAAGMQFKAKGASFYNSDKKEIINNTFESLKDVKLRMQMNSSYGYTMIRNSVNDARSIYADELAGLLQEAKLLQSKAISNSNTNVVDTKEFTTSFSFFEILAKAGNNIIHTSRIIGYIIDKYEIRNDGNFLLKEPIVLDGQNSHAAIDFKVKYGSTYSYSIRAIAETTFTAVDSNSNDIHVIKALISSKPNKRIQIQCVEKTPPPPPADFNISWDYKKNHPRLTWNFPTNPQRDIKKFQIFRRTSIDEPYELIHMYDFNDSTKKINGFETISPELITESAQPTLMFVDNEFKKDSNYIYALCSIDAHGLSSNYSIQYNITFDRISNKIKKKIISTSGAPKSYPNLYLLADTFVDAILDSGHSHIKVVFNPEFLNLTDKNGDDMDLLTIANKGKYRLQFINVDFQQQQVLDIFLEDKVGQVIKSNTSKMLPKVGSSGVIIKGKTKS